MTNVKYWLNSFIFGHEEELSPRGLRRHEQLPFHESYGGECPGVYYIRLQRDGWTLVRHGTESRQDGYTIFEKQLPEGWVLQKKAHATINHPAGKGCYFDIHTLRHPKHGQALDFPDWEWAEFDGERLPWIEKGVLYASRLTSKGIGLVRQLYDFNPLSFEGIAA